MQKNEVVLSLQAVAKSFGNSRIIRDVTMDVYARSEAEALQRAIQHFRPKKRERDKVTISSVIEVAS